MHPPNPPPQKKKKKKKKKTVPILNNGVLVNCGTYFCKELLELQEIQSLGKGMPVFLPPRETLRQPLPQLASLTDHGSLCHKETELPHDARYNGQPNSQPIKLF